MHKDLGILLTRLTAKEVKKIIAEKMNNRKKRISVALGEVDPNYERIYIKFPHTCDFVSLNSIQDILQKSGFKLVQILNFMQTDKTWLLLCRDGVTSFK